MPLIVLKVLQVSLTFSKFGKLCKQYMNLPIRMVCIISRLILKSIGDAAKGIRDKAKAASETAKNMAGTFSYAYVFFKLS